MALLLFTLSPSRWTVAEGGQKGKKYWQTGDPWPNQIPKPTPIHLTVRSSASSENDSFTYSYSVSASSINQWGISLWFIDLRVSPSINYHQAYSDAYYGGKNIISELSRQEQLTVLRQSYPKGWNACVGKKQGCWDAIYRGLAGTGILPGQTQSGFSITAKALPGIRECILLADLAPLDDYYRRLPTEEDYEYYSDSPEFTTEFWKVSNFTAKCLGPTEIPEAITVSTWTTRMISYATEGRSLDWIQTDSQLSKIKALISALNTDSKHKLKKTVGEIERYVLAERKAGRLSDEADALVRLNAVYLLHRVEKEPNILK